MIVPSSVIRYHCIRYKIAIICGFTEGGVPVFMLRSISRQEVLPVLFRRSGTGMLLFPAKHGNLSRKYIALALKYHMN